MSDFMFLLSIPFWLLILGIILHRGITTGRWSLLP